MNKNLDIFPVWFFVWIDCNFALKESTPRVLTIADDFTGSIFSEESEEKKINQELKGTKHNN
jgi:hypothetical protein